MTWRMTRRAQQQASERRERSNTHTHTHTHRHTCCGAVGHDRGSSCWCALLHEEPRYVGSTRSCSRILAGGLSEPHRGSSCSYFSRARERLWHFSQTRRGNGSTSTTTADRNVPVAPARVEGFLLLLRRRCGSCGLRRRRAGLVLLLSGVRLRESRTAGDRRGCTWRREQERQRRHTKHDCTQTGVPAAAERVGGLLLLLRLLRPCPLPRGPGAAAQRRAAEEECLVRAPSRHHTGAQVTALRSSKKLTQHGDAGGDAGRAGLLARRRQHPALASDQAQARRLPLGKRPRSLVRRHAAWESKQLPSSWAPVCRHVDSMPRLNHQWTPSFA